LETWTEGHILSSITNRNVHRRNFHCATHISSQFSRNHHKIFSVITSVFFHNFVSFQLTVLAFSLMFQGFQIYISIFQHIVTCRGDYRQVLDWIYCTLFTQLGTTGNYSAIAYLHTLQFTFTHALGFSVFTSRILATDFITVSLSIQITHEVLLSQPNSFLSIILQLATQKTQIISNPLPISWQAGIPILDSSLSTPVLFC
jgi:hypothetical protein